MKKGSKKEKKETKKERNKETKKERNKETKKERQKERKKKRKKKRNKPGLASRCACSGSVCDELFSGIWGCSRRFALMLTDGRTYGWTNPLIEMRGLI